MRTLKSYLSEYSESHQNTQNVIIHNICVPAIMWSLLGFAATFGLSEKFNAAHVIVISALLYYSLFKNARVLAAMALISGLMLLSFSFIPQLRWVSLAVFVVAWAGQFYGHKVEGKKPSFMKDLQFLLIGPVWLLQKWAAPFFLLK
jgi:uncharacterized membrane protein YGL010W